MPNSIVPVEVLPPGALRTESLPGVTIIESKVATPVELILIFDARVGLGYVPVKAPPALPEGVAVTLVNAAPLPENAPAVTVPVVLIAVLPPIVPEVIVLLVKVCVSEVPTTAEPADKP